MYEYYKLLVSIFGENVLCRHVVKLFYADIQMYVKFVVTSISSIVVLLFYVLVHLG